jgi:hypothetical protein
MFDVLRGASARDTALGRVKFIAAGRGRKARHQHGRWAGGGSAQACRLAGWPAHRGQPELSHHFADIAGPDVARVDRAEGNPPIVALPW